MVLSAIKSKLSEAKKQEWSRMESMVENKECTTEFVCMCTSTMRCRAGFLGQAC